MAEKEDLVDKYLRTSAITEQKLLQEKEEQQQKEAELFAERRTARRLRELVGHLSRS